MSRIGILIVDDEPLARTRLRRLVSLDPDCEVIGECANGIEAVRAHSRLHPDIVFLDEQMPGMDGFEVMRAISESHPLVILASAHGEHALRAFEAYVFDYLLKPFGRQRFYESLRRAKARIACNRACSDARVADPVRTDPLPERIAVKSNGSLVFVKLEEIDWFEAADN